MKKKEAKRIIELFCNGFIVIYAPFDLETDYLASGSFGCKDKEDFRLFFYNFPGCIDLLEEDINDFHIYKEYDWTHDL